MTELLSIIFRDSLDSPTEIPSDYLNAAQVRGLIASGMVCEFSDDAENWHAEQTGQDRFFHFRLENSSGEWSDPVGLIAGTKGDAGKDAFCYVAYASDSTGTGFSLTPANGLKFRAEIHPAAEIPEPSAGDFQGVAWIKYCGDDGQGVGDMLKSVYDPNNDGKVLAAEEADHALGADSVPWDGITDQPSAFAPQAHQHEMADIANPVYQKVYSASNPKTLYADTPILRNSTANSSGTIELEFTSILDKIGGASRGVSGSEMLTWEYHVPCNAIVTGVSVGSTSSSMVGINIPETLELINGNPTVHVFVIRAVYKSGAINNIRYQANYAYSYEA